MKKARLEVSTDFRSRPEKKSAGASSSVSRRAAWRSSYLAAYRSLMDRDVLPLKLIVDRHRARARDC
jgi:hypothetical protein